jgi:hypothetical protein
MDIRGTVQMMYDSGVITNLANNPMNQFGPASQPLLSASLMPEQTVPQNEYREENIQYRTVIANDGTRYSPVQKKRGILAGWMDVRLANQDIGSDFTSSDYDTFLSLLNSNADMDAVTNLLNWTDLTLVRPLNIKIEKMRWDCLIDASCVLTGDNNYRETVAYPNPTGHRVATGGSWADDAYDAYLDIVKGVEFLASKGYTASRIISSTPVVSTLQNNDKIKERAGSVALSSISGLTTVPGRVSRTDLNGMLGQDNIPPIEVYDQQYKTQTGSGFYLKRDVLIIIASTARDRTVAGNGDNQPITVPDTLGYVGVGRPAGQSSAGRRVLLTPYENKPPRIEGEAWQTTFPVMTDPESVYVINTINTAYD